MKKIWVFFYFEPKNCSISTKENKADPGLKKINVNKTKNEQHNEESSQVVKKKTSVIVNFFEKNKEFLRMFDFENMDELENENTLYTTLHRLKQIEEKVTFMILFI